jgi:outer membrane protein assembly factor BamB
MIPAAIARVLIVACLRIGTVLSVLYRFIIGRRQRKARRYITRACAAVTAGVALAALGVTGASASAAAPRAAPATAAGTSHASAGPGTQLWAKRYDGPGNNNANAVAASPTGQEVFVTGFSTGTTTGEDYVTIAYNAATGAQLWVKRYNGPGNNNDYANSVAVSPSGETVYVTGSSYGGPLNYDYATIAYNAATGAQLWVKRYIGAEDGADATAVAVSPTGNTVYVTGDSYSPTVGANTYATVAYNSATGAQLWVKSYEGPTNNTSDATSMVVSPNGNTVFVTGYSFVSGTRTTLDYDTVAYNAATGAQQWAKTYNGPGNSTDEAYSVAVSPTGSTVFVTGESTGTLSVFDYATVAYNAATGAQQWAKRYNGAGSIGGEAHSVAVSPSGSTVFVTGEATSGSGDYATIAYNAATGAQQWAKTYNGTANSTDDAHSVAVSPNGSTVYVTGYTTATTTGEDYGTVAYNAATGAQQWVKRYNGPIGRSDFAYSVAVSPTSGTVFVTGNSGNGPFYGYATVAYQG